MKTVKSPLHKPYANCWPIKRSELHKFCSMAILMFLILLNQNIIRGIKDSMVVTLIGSEVLSFIKLFVEMPVGIIFVLLYAMMCNTIRTENIFRIIVFFFLGFFIVFNFFLLPYQNVLHPDPTLVQKYIQLYPYLKWFFMMWGKWTLVGFYVIGELWPMIVFTLLYWQLANQITTTEEAGRLYFYFNLVGQTNLIVYRKIIMFLACKKTLYSPLLGIHTPHSITSLMGIVMALSLLIILLHRYIEVYIVSCQPCQPKTSKPVEVSLSSWKCLALIVRSKYLILVCLLMIAYSMTINLIEGLWYYKVNLMYNNNDTDLRIYLSKISYWTGIVTLICSLLGSTIIQKLGWLKTALITPTMTWVMGGFFFLFIVIQHSHGLPDQVIGLPTLGTIVTIGSIQNILAKGTKYCFFDSTKEMAYIPLNEEMQTKGKATVDILGGKIGKSAGSIVQVICYTVFSTKTPDQLAPCLMAVFCAICTIWVGATYMLAKQYQQLVTKS